MFTESNCGNKLVFDQKDTAAADMCFSNIKITRSFYQTNHANFFEEKFESIPDNRNKSVIYVLK